MITLRWQRSFQMECVSLQSQWLPWDSVGNQSWRHQQLINRASYHQNRTRRYIFIYHLLKAYCVPTTVLSACSHCLIELPPWSNPTCEIPSLSLLAGVGAVSKKASFSLPQVAQRVHSKADFEPQKSGPQPCSQLFRCSHWCIKPRFKEMYGLVE